MHRSGGENRAVELVYRLEDGGAALLLRQTLELDKFRVLVVELGPVLDRIASRLPEGIRAVPEWRQV